jgi:hypothetical protein
MTYSVYIFMLFRRTCMDCQERSGGKELCQQGQTHKAVPLRGWWMLDHNHVISWLVVWNMNFMTFHILGMSSSQLTNSYFSEGLKPPTSKYLWVIPSTIIRTCVLFFEAYSLWYSLSTRYTIKTDQQKTKYTVISKNPLYRGMVRYYLA